MSANVINPAHKPLPVSNLFMSRQPILDRSHKLVAYSLLFRNAPLDPQNPVSDSSETAAVLAHFSELGIDDVIDDALGFIAVDADVLMSPVIDTLPAAQVVLEITYSEQMTPETLARIAELVKAGYRFALSGVGPHLDDAQAILPYIEIVKLPHAEMIVSVLKPIVTQLQLLGKKILAERVETLAQFERCMDLGFDYFHGYYFAMPEIVPGKTLSPSQMSALHLMALIVSDAESAELEQALKSDVSISLNLLRLVNTPAVGKHRIDSIKQALMVLGRNQLQRWLQIVLYAEPEPGSPNKKALMLLALTRGKLMEMIAYKHRAGNTGIADTAFMVGIMSLMDTLFSLPMAEVLQETAVLEDAVDALLYRKGYFGELLALVEDAELIDAPQTLLAQVKNLHLSSEDFYLMQLSAFEWSDKISHFID